MRLPAFLPSSTIQSHGLSPCFHRGFQPIPFDHLGMYAVVSCFFVPSRMIHSGACLPGVLLPRGPPFFLSPPPATDVPVRGGRSIPPGCSRPGGRLLAASLRPGRSCPVLPTTHCPGWSSPSGAVALRSGSSQGEATRRQLACYWAPSYSSPADCVRTALSSPAPYGAPQSVYLLSSPLCSCPPRSCPWVSPALRPGRGRAAHRAGTAGGRGRTPLDWIIRGGERRENRLNC